MSEKSKPTRTPRPVQVKRDQFVTQVPPEPPVAKEESPANQPTAPLTVAPELEQRKGEAPIQRAISIAVAVARGCIVGALQLQMNIPQSISLTWKGCFRGRTYCYTESWDVKTLETTLLPESFYVDRALDVWKSCLLESGVSSKGVFH